jgi:DNA polymerase III subunit beta
MKFQVERDVLAEAVAWTARTLPGRSALPILGGMLVEANSLSESVTLSSFDFEVAGRTSVDAPVVEGGRALVSGRLFAEITKALPPHPVDVSMDGAKVVLRCGGTRFTLQTMPVEDYPALPSLPPLAGTIGSDLFAAAVAQVTIAAARDATVPILSGVRVQISGDRLRLACIDRFRIAVRDLPWQPAHADMNALALVPARAVATMARSWSNGAEARLYLAGDGEDTMIGFECGGRRSMSRLLENQFLDYLSRFPTTYASTAEMSTGALIDAVKRVALVAERTAPTRLSFESDQLVLEAATGEEAHAIEVLPVAFHGEPIRIAFNAQYLLEGLHALDSDTARLAFTSPSQPALLTGKPDPDGVPGDDYRYLVMPLRLT